MESEERIDKLIVTSPSLYSNYTLKNLWIVSFCYCDPFPQDVSALTEYACLGFLDVSFTKINLKQVQEVSKQTHILRFHYFGTPLIESVDNHRGFIINTAPKIWVLNGIYVSWVERKKHYDYFLHNRHSVIERKWKIDDNSVFIPTRSKQNDGNNKIWHKASRYWLGDCPLSFNMAVDYDVWKLNKLSLSLERYVGVVDDFIRQLIVPEAISKGPSITSTNSTLVLIGTLLPWFSITLLHQTCRTILQKYNSVESLCFWKLGDRLSLLALLIGRMHMDHTSIVHQVYQKFKLSEKKRNFLQNFVIASLKCNYPFETDDEFDFDSFIQRAGREMNNEFKSKMLDTNDSEEFAWVNLSILELICMGSNNVSFMEHFSTLLEILEKYCKSKTLNLQALNLDKQSAIELKLKMILIIRKSQTRILERAPSPLFCMHTKLH
jgi:hypothetical protein